MLEDSSVFFSCEKICWSRHRVTFPLRSSPLLDYFTGRIVDLEYGNEAQMRSNITFRLEYLEAYHKKEVLCRQCRLNHHYLLVKVKVLLIDSPCGEVFFQSVGGGQSLTVKQRWRLSMVPL